MKESKAIVIYIGEGDTTLEFERQEVGEPQEGKEIIHCNIIIWNPSLKRDVITFLKIIKTPIHKRMIL